MRRILLGAAALFAWIGAAQAADLPPRYPAKAPAVAPAVVPPSWTGFYVGGAFGYGFWDMDTNLTLPTVPGAVTGQTNNGGRGWVGQAVVGYDYQFSVMNFNLVAGVFGDYSFGDMTGTVNLQAATSPFNTLGGVEKERSYWDAGARIGWLVTPQILSYFNGGYTEARFNGIALGGTGLLGTFAAMSTPANTYHGWFTGGGVETQITSIPGLFFNTEYRFSSYSSATLAINNSVAIFGPPVSVKFEPHVQTVMSGIRYKFNWGP